MKIFAALFVISTLISGCCSHGSEECEEGISITILYDPSSKIEDMTVRYTDDSKTSEEAESRPKKKQFFIDETSADIKEKTTIEVVLDGAVISEETYNIKWNRAVCNQAEGPGWCADDTYEWAELEIDLREEEEALE